MKMRWRMKKTESGEIRFILAKAKPIQEKQGGTIYATLTTKMIREEKVGIAKEQIARAGGSVSSLRGRLMTVEVEGENVEEVGEVFDSFGCQWDLS
jgi:hypothetical protein